MSQMMPINTNRPRITASSAHTYSDHTSTNGKVDSSQQALLEYESTSAYDSLRDHENIISAKIVVHTHIAFLGENVIISRVRVACMNPELWPSLYNSQNSQIPNGERFRGVPLY